jgi:hypothetical protein
VILERRVLIQKLGLDDNHHNHSVLARNKTTSSLEEKISNVINKKGASETIFKSS